jgi:hypothetical protein
VKAVLFTALITLGSLASGCANVAGTDGYRASRLGSRYTASGATTLDPSLMDFVCPETDNVVPDYDRYFDGLGYYKACANKTYLSKVLIKGQPGESVCVYPVQYVDERNIFVKPSVSIGQPGPLSQCGTIPTSGLLVEFSDVSYNMVFIARKSDKASMDSCLTGTPNYYACPQFAYGKFR